jgi:uncharacterized protein (TIGR00645 family)
MRELWHIVTHMGSLDETQIMLLVLGLVDVGDVANLLIMVIIGGYETFVSRIDVEGHPDEPGGLSHVNANVLKVKLAMAIVGISSIHLLRTFHRGGGAHREGAALADVIHITFLLSALALAFIDRMSLPQMRGHEHCTRSALPPRPPPSDEPPGRRRLV